MTTQLLLIDGTSSLPPTYQSSLNEAGYRIRICRSGAEGLIAFQELRPQVVLLDLVLPDRDGLEVLKEILTISPDTRVIVITATGSIDRAVDAMRAGAHEFLLKPFNEQRFLAAIRNASRSESNAPIQSLAAIPPPEDDGFHRVIGCDGKGL
ncbi:response regulator [Thalassobius sp. I31.1]|uniref:response regulator n=1 Tax=Thalassobius sp. I31.1 TaxID=2109912 RepID=UPI001E61617D|nr:response regulator [Thalassobius sp. I31.1]